MGPGTIIFSDAEQINKVIIRLLITTIQKILSHSLAKNGNPKIWQENSRVSYNVPEELIIKFI